MSYLLTSPPRHRGYFVTFNVTVFEVALPFFGVTVTVTLHDPVLRPLRVVPETLQNFEELRATFSETFEVAITLIFADTASDLFVIGLLIEIIAWVVPRVLRAAETVGPTMMGAGVVDVRASFKRSIVVDVELVVMLGSEIGVVVELADTTT